jgi:hypothetical protein
VVSTNCAGIEQYRLLTTGARSAAGCCGEWFGLLQWFNQWLER